MHMIDAGLPQDRSGDLAERVAALEDYLYQLLEELRYLLRNLDLQQNVNSASLEKYTKEITDPEPEDTAPRNMTAAKLTADEITALKSILTPILSAGGLRADGYFINLDPSYGLILGSAVYGDTLPQGNVAGRLFFKRVT